MKEALELHNQAVMRLAGHSGSDHMVVLRAYEVMALHEHMPCIFCSQFTKTSTMDSSSLLRYMRYAI
jgi:hypothetical protein